MAEARLCWAGPAGLGRLGFEIAARLGWAGWASKSLLGWAGPAGLGRLGFEIAARLGGAGWAGPTGLRNRCLAGRGRLGFEIVARLGWAGCASKSLLGWAASAVRSSPDCLHRPAGLLRLAASAMPSTSLVDRLHCFELCFVQLNWRRKAPMQI